MTWVPDGKHGGVWGLDFEHEPKTALRSWDLRLWVLWIWDLASKAKADRQSWVLVLGIWDFLGRNFKDVWRILFLGNFGDGLYGFKSFGGFKGGFFGAFFQNDFLDMILFCRIF